jgi:hypothetical protein
MPYRAQHGATVAALAAGSLLGVAPAANVIAVQTRSNVGFRDQCAEKWLDALIWIADDIAANPSRRGTSVINFSYGIPVHSVSSAYSDAIRKSYSQVFGFAEALLTDMCGFSCYSAETGLLGCSICYCGREQGKNLSISRVV